MEVQSIEEENVIQRDTSDGKYKEEISDDDDNTKNKLLPRCHVGRPRA